MSDDAQSSNPLLRAADPQSVEGLFLSALGQASDEQRRAFLDEACGADVERRRRVEALLRAYDDAGSFLERPPLGPAPDATVSLDFLTPSDDPSLMGMLGPYEVYELLGRGGMGIVFRARDPKLNRVVAIKVLAPELAANPNARRRFLREAQAAAAISHPHVVTIHAVDEGEPPSILPFIVMECIVGQTLQQKLDKQGSLRLTEILRIGHQVAEGLAAAHKQGLVHRDIKPANVLLENGVERVKITDFGLARATDDVSITRTGEVSGTPQYMSPEQASGGVIDHRSDLFSLGCVLYAMCTGRSPFRATTLAAAIKRVCSDAPRPIGEINPEVPSWLVEIVNHLLAKNPDERIQTAAEVAALLGEHLAGVQLPTGRRLQPERPVSGPPVRKPISAGTPVSLRACLWLGSLLLLTPVVIALGGTAVGAGGDALEGAVMAALFCVPAAVVVFAIALMDRSFEGNPTANAVFILCCVLLGPIGILLYLVRRDQWSTPRPMLDVPSVREPHGGAPSRPEAASRSDVMPQWLVTPLPGPVKVLSAGLFALAGLMIGQGLEQWSDHSAEVGVSLQVAGWLLGILSVQLARAAGVPFTPMHALAAGLLAVILMIFGAQGPDREFADGLATSEHVVVLVCMAVSLMSLAGMMVLATRGPDRDGGAVGLGGVALRDRLGFILMALGLLLVAFLVGYGVLVGAEVVPPPPIGHGEPAARLMMALVVVGSVLFGLGMILQRRVLMPGMVRQLATATEGRAADGMAVGLGSGPPRTPLSPWRVLGWMIVGGLVLIPTGFAVLLGVPYFALRDAREGIVTLQFDSLRPVTKVVVHGDIGAAHAQQRIEEHLVTQSPFSLALPEGVYDLTLTYQADGTSGQVTQRVRAVAGERKTVDVRQAIALAHQRQHIDRLPPRLDPDGYPPPRVIPLTENGSSAATQEGGTRPTPPAPLAPAPAGALSPSISIAPLTPAQGERAGQLTIDVRDDGFLVALRRKSAFGGVDLGSEQQITEYGSTFLRLHPGEYEVLIRDELFGWGERTETVTVGTSGYQEIVVERDLTKYAQTEWGGRPVLMRIFHWDGKKYGLASRYGMLLINRLLQAHVDGTPEVPSTTLLAELLAARGDNPSGRSEAFDIQPYDGEPLEEVARTLFADTPIWGELIVPGEAEGTYRLAPLDRGTVSIADIDEGMTVTVMRIEPDRRFSQRTLSDDTVLSVPPGEYRVWVSDQFVGWGIWDAQQGFGPGFAELPRTETVTLATGETHAVKGDRRFVDYLNPPKPGPDSTAIRFNWYPPADEVSGLPGFGGGWVSGVVLLDRWQFPVLLELLIAVAAGEPDVAEARLLEVAQKQADADDAQVTIDEWSDLFADTTGAGGNWRTVIVPGEAEGTWRLKPPPAVAGAD